MSARAAIIGEPRRVLVKIGSAVLSTPDGALDRRRVRRLSEQFCALADRGVQPIVVSSGAILAGMGELGLDTRPTTMPALQAVAAVGQCRLMHAYNESFRRHGRHVGQLLLSREDMEVRSRYLNVRNTLRSLLDQGCVPVINENDTVTVEEIRYGDNDFLTAHLSALALADLVVMLSTVDGLLGSDDTVLPVVEDIDESVLEMDTGGRSGPGTGGMGSKLRAASVITRAGVPVVVANGRRRDVLLRVLAGEDIGTLFLPAARKMASRKRWLAFTARPKGKLIVDAGAQRALVAQGKSLLASGIRSVTGTFKKGDVVELAVDDGEAFAQGLANYPSHEVERICGRHTRDIKTILGYKDYDEVVHRDNLVVLA
ncbi:glutamate 5-kinase [bacterium]|nr:glutamate 5-kinase [bacterium]